MRRRTIKLSFSDNCSSGGGARRGCSKTGGLPVLITDPEEKCRHYGSGDCQPQFDTSEYTSIVSEVSLGRFYTMWYFLGHGVKIQ